MSAQAAGVLDRPSFSALFAIGLKPIGDVAAWLAPDARLGVCLDQKDRLIATRRDGVFAARADTLEAQGEVLAWLGAHLPTAFADTYALLGQSIAIAGVEAPVSIAPHTDPSMDRHEPPLLRASRLVADDLVLMRKHDDGWRLVAASLCFPSYWRLHEKFDRPLAAIHAPVPGFGDGSRNAMLIERMFDNLRPGMIVSRSNLSFHDNPDLHRPDPHCSHLFDSDIGPTALARIFLRSEDQTLAKLPNSGDVLFTIRVATDPIAQIESRPDLAADVAGRLRALNIDQCHYKGLAAGRAQLVDWLDVLGNQRA